MVTNLGLVMEILQLALVKAIQSETDLAKVHWLVSVTVIQLERVTEFLSEKEMDLGLVMEILQLALVMATQLVLD